MLAQGHNLSLPPKLVNLVSLKHVEVNNLDGDTFVQWLIVGVVYNSRRTIPYTQKGEEAYKLEGV